ncbi:type II toxin-antitoxin system HicA family toxin [Candidatus Uhrbacteria bacterium]|nr:type II toxin-antitoxin system HicA family toxin [Candidatus Uhrbacteria bacterium]
MMRMLEHLGYRIVRIRGSHHFFFNTMTRRTTSIPLHGGEELGIGLIKQILRDIEVSAEEYDTLRKEVS